MRRAAAVMGRFQPFGLVFPMRTAAADAAAADMMSRLQRISMKNCRIGNVGLAQMAASMPPHSAVPLVYLDLR
jgi:hypothetical protein